MNEDRVALHHDLSAKLTAAYRDAVEQGAFTFPAEFVIADDMVLWSPQLGQGVELPYAKEVAAVGLTIQIAAGLEMDYYWHKLPDFRAVGPVRKIVSDEGWAQWWTFECTAEDGRVLRLHEADFILTNPSGEVVRWEAFVDRAELAAILKALSGRSYEDGISWADYMGLINDFHADRAANPSPAV